MQPLQPQPGAPFAEGMCFAVWLWCTHTETHAHTVLALANTPTPSKKALCSFLLRDVLKPDGNIPKSTGRSSVETHWCS